MCHVFRGPKESNDLSLVKVVVNPKDCIADVEAARKGQCVDLKHKCIHFSAYMGGFDPGYVMCICPMGEEAETKAKEA